MKKRGFRAIKLGWDPFGQQSLAEDENLVRTARRAAGDEMTLLIDAGGSLTASNIEIDTQFIISDSDEARRIFNPGYFRLAGAVQMGDANEQLGRFILANCIQWSQLCSLQCCASAPKGLSLQPTAFSKS